MGKDKEKKEATESTEEAGEEEEEGIDICELLKTLLEPPPWVPAIDDLPLATLFYRLAKQLVAAKPTTLAAAQAEVAKFFQVKDEEVALLHVVGVPAAVILRAFRSDERWLGRAVIATFNTDVLEDETEVISDENIAALKALPAFDLLRDLVIDVLTRNPRNVLSFCASWADATPGVKDRRRMDNTHSAAGFAVSEDMLATIPVRYTRVVREFIVFLAIKYAGGDTGEDTEEEAEEAEEAQEADGKPDNPDNPDNPEKAPEMYVELCECDLTYVQTTIYHVDDKTRVAAIPWLLRRLQYFDDTEIDTTKIGESFLDVLYRTVEAFPFSDPLLCTLKRLAYHLAREQTLPTHNPTLNAEILLMHDLEMPLTVITSDAEHSWLQKVGGFLVAQLPSSTPLYGSSPCSGLDASLQELTCLMPTLTDKEICQYFELMLASGYGSAVEALYVWKKDFKNTELELVATMIHYLWYIPELDKLFQGCKDGATETIRTQLQALSTEAENGFEEKSLFLGARDQHFLTALSYACFYGHVETVRAMVAEGAQNLPPIREGVINEYLVRYVTDVCTSLQTHKATMRCGQCKGPLARATMQQLRKEEYDLAFSCNICMRTGTCGTSLHCSKCSYDVCSACALLGDSNLESVEIESDQNQADRPGLARLLLLKRLFAAMQKDLGFGDEMDRIWPDTKWDAEFPLVTPKFLLDLEEMVKRKDPSLPTIQKAVGYGWHPYSAAFFAHVLGDEELLQECIVAGFTLQPYEEKALQRYQEILSDLICASESPDSVAGQRDDVFFLKPVRVGNPQPAASSEFTRFLTQLATIFPDDFTEGSMTQILAQTRAFVLLFVLHPEYAGPRGSMAATYVAIIFLYTLQTPIYQQLNAAYWQHNKEKQALWAPFSSQLNVALQALPSYQFVDAPFPGFTSDVQAATCRGLNIRVDPKQYAEGEIVTLDNYTSSSLSAFIAHSFGAQGTILVLKLRSFKLISMCSNYPSEQEFLAVPGTRFKVVKAYHSPLEKTAPASSIQALIYFVLACTQPEASWENCEKLDVGSESIPLGTTLTAIHRNATRAFELTFGQSSYSLIYMEEIE
eukprot:TRINITY_DN4169_c0_g1_i1.p1 TRINITY_DN4169_c0_g1~~TRINITY_DN4169_c0_g1_i1.p1  ORF type:complete len:1090 (-),score=210.66 TRINITY_DN4169_c0_g1_i1:14-3253(-)